MQCLKQAPTFEAARDAAQQRARACVACSLLPQAQAQRRMADDRARAPARQCTARHIYRVAHERRHSGQHLHSVRAAFHRTALLRQQRPGPQIRACPSKPMLN